MALQIMKLAIEATSSMNTNPVVEHFFCSNNTLVTGPDTLILDAKSFFDSTGATVIALPALTTANSYYKVYINGVLQMDDLLTYKSGSSGSGNLTITVPQDSSILPNSPIVLEITNFLPDAYTTVHT